MKTARQQRNTSHPGYGEAGIAFVDLAIWLPVLIALVLATGFLYKYVRAYQVVKYAAESAAGIASGAEIKSISTGNSYLKWSHQLGGSIPYRPFTFNNSEFCRQTTPGDASKLRDCVDGQQTAENIFGLLWSDYASTNSSPIGTSFSLPFSLTSYAGSTPGYFPVQMLPIVGIERACFEPLNETGGVLSASGRFYIASGTGADSSLCNHVRPMYWQSPVMADFDGDGKEDVVLFKPNGTSTSWGTRVNISEMDFIVYYSGAGYSASAGHGMFNLAVDTSDGVPRLTPNTIPIVADYDRDGLADYAVFDPRTGLYRVAFSASNYRVIGEGDMHISDPNGQYGLVAIPGTYTRTDLMQLAVLKTGGDTGADRFSIYISDAIQPSAGDLNGSNGASIALPGGHNVSGNEVSANKLYQVRPQPGTISVPAFADYDDDGIVEMGYLSWYGGNMSRQVAGASLGVRSPAFNTYVETVDAPPRTPMSFRINPYAIDFDSSNNMYVTDAVDGRIWKIDAGNFDGAGSLSSNVINAVMPNHATQSGRLLTPNPELKFGKENVWNIGNDRRASTEGNDAGTVIQAGRRGLRMPRRFFIANGYDDAMYVADFGNTRIIRVEPDGPGIGAASTSSIILGSNQCRAGTCTGLTDGNSGAAFDKWSTTNGKYQIYPGGIALVPDPTNNNRYFVAFSTKAAVYLIKHTNATGGPRGDKFDSIWKIGGSQTAMVNTVINNPNSTYSQMPGSALGSTICPVSDMKYTDAETPSGALYLATSCSIIQTPGDDPTTLVSRDSGQILALVPALNAAKNYSFTDDNNEGIQNQLKPLVGAAWQSPCLTAGRCSEPTAAGGGAYERHLKVVTNAPAFEDLINPTAITVTTAGQVYFIDQWNDGTQTDATKYPSAGNIRDQIHRHDVYMWEGSVKNKKSLVPFNNPFLSGDGLVPTESVDWYSPYTNSFGATPSTRILAHPGPVKTVPFPAAAGIAINNNRLYVTTPFVQDATGITSSHPYHVTPLQVGFIYSADLDADGDGVMNASDADVDGDGIADAQEVVGSGASAYCPEIFGATASKCRYQERFGLPRQTFFKLQGGLLRLNGEGAVTEPNAQNSATYGEFLLMNSVAECGDSSQCSPPSTIYRAGNVRPEVWATLLEFGNDADYEATFACTNANDADSTSPYANCLSTANGPIAAPQPLHALTGWHTAGGAYNYSGYPGYHFLAKSVTGSRRAPDPNLFLFPTILSSTKPKENGIKPTRWPYVDSSKSPGIRKSGVLCRDYQPEENGLGTPLAATGLPFRLNFDNYPSTYFYEGFDTTWDSSQDNDSFSYIADCSVAQASKLVDNRVPAVEGIVLQLDHDDTTGKESTSPQTAVHWPYQGITGSPQNPENSRMFLMIDHDGNGVRDPTFVLPGSASGGTAFNTDPMVSPTTLVGFGLRNSTDTNDPTTINYIDQFRWPFSDLTLLLSEGWTDANTPTPPWLRRDSTLAAGTYFTFDGGRQGASYLRDNAFFLGLDFEPYISGKLQIGNRQDVGASMYTNYTRSTRFRSTPGGDIPPAILAAKNALKISFGLAESDFVESPDALDNGKACIRFMANGTKCEGLTSDDTVLSCDSIEIQYGTKYLGSNVTIVVQQPLNPGYLNNYKEECDPDGAGSGFSCS